MVHLTGRDASSHWKGQIFAIEEPSSFNTQWCSHKFSAPGVCYKIRICLQMGWIVWWSGSCPCGVWPDLNIARDWLIDEMDDWLSPMEDTMTGGGTL